MRKRIFWIAVGVGLAGVVFYQVRKVQRAATPAGIADMVGHQASQWSDRIADFIDTFTEATAERETELRSATGFEQEETRA